MIEYLLGISAFDIAVYLPKRDNIQQVEV